jgi:hypothetical protein
MKFLAGSCALLSLLTLCNVVLAAEQADKIEKAEKTEQNIQQNVQNVEKVEKIEKTEKVYKPKQARLIYVRPAEKSIYHERGVYEQFGSQPQQLVRVGQPSTYERHYRTTGNRQLAAIDTNPEVNPNDRWNPQGYLPEAVRSIPGSNQASYDPATSFNQGRFAGYGFNGAEDNY